MQRSNLRKHLSQEDQHIDKIHSEKLNIKPTVLLL